MPPEKPRLKPEVTAGDRDSRDTKPKVLANDWGWRRLAGPDQPGFAQVEALAEDMRQASPRVVPGLRSIITGVGFSPYLVDDRGQLMPLGSGWHRRGADQYSVKLNETRFTVGVKFAGKEIRLSLPFDLGALAYARTPERLFAARTTLEVVVGPNRKPAIAYREADGGVKAVEESSAWLCLARVILSLKPDKSLPGVSRPVSGSISARVEGRLPRKVAPEEVRAVKGYGEFSPNIPLAGPTSVLAKGEHANKGKTTKQRERAYRSALKKEKNRRGRGNR